MKHYNGRFSQSVSPNAFLLVQYSRSLRILQSSGKLTREFTFTVETVNTDLPDIDIVDVWKSQDS